MPAVGDDSGYAKGAASFVRQHLFGSGGTDRLFAGMDRACGSRRPGKEHEIKNGRHAEGLCVCGIRG